MIFCDMGVHPTPWGFSAYDKIIRKLIERGIPREQIAAVGDADSDAKKQALFERVRQGSIRVLLGSTTKMGTGTNVQRRLIALHHLDAPWKPAEVEQREGRILRQGNENPEVSIYRYVTQGSFDSYMWQALETKARFISQVMTGDNGLRRADDIGAQELSYAEVKAIASGNPAVLTLAEADAELQRLALLKKNHMDEQYVARRNVRILPDTIAGLSERLASLSADKATAIAHADDSIVIGKHVVLRQDVMAALGQLLDSTPRTVSDMRRIPLGVYHGLRFGIILHAFSAPDAYLEGAATIRSTLFRDPGPRAVLNALERLASSYALECERAQRDLSVAEGQLRDYQARLGRPFALDSYLAQLTALRDQLRAGLSAAPAEEGEEKRPDVSELAEQIKALKAANTFDSAPGRTAKRVVAAEEPVTTRIRRRTETSLTADATEPDVIELPERTSPPHESIQPPAMHEQRVARGR